MKARCSNPRSIVWPLYGGRGITVCRRWKAFEAFFADMGPRPSPHHTIERKDNCGDYTPSNCIWATRKQQMNNQRNNHIITFLGKTQTLAQWVDELHMPALRVRLGRGWSVQRAFTQPLQ